MSLIQTLLDPIEEIKQQFSDETNNQEDNDKNETVIILIVNVIITNTENL